MKIIKIVTRCQIWLKCTKSNYGWVSALDPAGGAYSAPTSPLAGFKGPTFKGSEEKRGSVGRGRVPFTSLGPRLRSFASELFLSCARPVADG